MKDKPMGYSLWNTGGSTDRVGKGCSILLGFGSWVMLHPIKEQLPHPPNAIPIEDVVEFLNERASANRATLLRALSEPA
jgi:hypothetical protein